MKNKDGIVKSILQWKLFRIISVKYPSTYKFILRRVSLDYFRGLPLTLIIITTISNAFLFFEIAEKIENGQFLQNIDLSIANLFHANRINFIARSLYFFTQVGSLFFVSLITLITSIYFLYKKYYAHIISLCSAVIGSSLTVLIGKAHFLRVRPADLCYYKEFSYSFPSGHSTIAVSFYGLLFYFFIRSLSNFKTKRFMTLVALLFIFLLGFSRIYLCVHYLSDVLAGYSLGFLWFLFAVSIVEWNYKNKYSDSPKI